MLTSIGKFLRKLRIDQGARTDIEYSVHQGKLSLHAHDYVGGARQLARPLTDKEKREFMKFFRGVK